MSQLAEEIVRRILEDISGRSGLGNAWDETSDEIQTEIKQEWSTAVDDAFAEVFSTEDHARQGIMGNPVKTAIDETLLGAGFAAMGNKPKFREYRPGDEG